MQHEGDSPTIAETRANGTYISVYGIKKRYVDLNLSRNVHGRPCHELLVKRQTETVLTHFS